MIKGKYVIKVDGEIVAEKDNLITTNGFFMINRHLARSSIEWAGALAVGTFTTAPAISDKALYYELDRMPITLKSYTKMNPRYVITNKAMASNVATLQFTSTTTPNLANGYKIQVSGIDTTFNGTYNITSYSVLSAPTTTAAGSYQITYSTSNSSTVSSTVVTNNNSLISVTADTLGNSVYNNEIVVKATLDSALNAVINEVGVLPLNLKNKNNSYMAKISDFSEQYYADQTLSGWTDVTAATSLSVIGLVNINASNGYSWATGTANVVFNVASTSGLKVGSTVYINGITPSGAYTAPSGTGAVYQINGNYQLTVTMGSTNSSGSTQTGYGGTMSLNSSSVVPLSNSGKFNVNLIQGHTISLQNISIDASNFSSSDSLLLLYYSGTAGTSQSISVILTDINSNSYTCTNSGISTLVGWNIARIPLASTFPATGATINQIQITGTTIPTTIYLDEIKFMNNDYWSVHPYASNSPISGIVAGYNGGTAAAGYATVTTTTPHNFSAGSTVTISGVDSGTTWNNQFTIYSVPTRYTFVIPNAATSNPALYSNPLAISAVTILVPPEYQLTSRSVFTNPIYKYAGQQMDIEYHLQVT
jgi:hypothetical protein